MKLKYYLRGLGTGIAVATLIIAISAGRNGGSDMTDEEILARAKELGLVERTVLSDMVKDDESDENTEEAVVDNVQSDTEETIQESVTEAIDEETPEETTENSTVEAEPEQEVEDNEYVTDIIEESSSVTDDPEETGDTDSEEESEENGFGMPDEAGSVTIVVKSGASSDSVSRQLEDAGLVDSASAYDKYLCQNGYDKSIRVGTYEIPADATGEEIAKMITGR